MNSSANLLSDFDDLSTEEWIKSIEKYLKGKAYNTIFKKVDNDTPIKPFYRKNESPITNLVIMRPNHWQIVERFEVGDIALTRTKIFAALESGVNAIELVIDKGDPKQLSQLLEGVHPEMIHWRLSGKAIDDNIIDWAKAIKQLPKGEHSKGVFNPKLQDSDAITLLLQKLQTILPQWSCIRFSVACANHSISTNLATALKKAELQFWTLLKAGMDKRVAAQAIYFDFKVQDDYFGSIASLRAFQKLWQLVLAAYNIEEVAQLLVKTTTSEASEDPYWNMIASTTQALAAAIAMPYSIEVCHLKTKKEDFGRRIVRNIQQLLKMESHIDEIIDPAAGSYYIESYTMALVKQAWEKFLS